MDNNKYYRNMEEDEIDLIDLIIVLLKHWKSIILCTLVFMLIGGGVSVLKNGGTSADSGTFAAADAAQQEADIRAGYELVIAQYESESKLYGMKADIFNEYSEAVSMLGEEIDRLNSIDKTDEDARLQCLVKISSLQNAVNNANGLLNYYSKLTKPAELQSYEDYKADIIKAEDKTSHARISLKYVLIGLVAGGFLSCAGWGMLYLLDGKIKTVSDVERYGVNILGSPDKVGFIAANVKNYISEDIKSVLITGTLPEDVLKNVADAVRMTAGIDDVRFASGLNYNADTAIILSDVDAVVLVERLKTTRQNDLKEELAMVSGAGKMLIGVAV